MYIIIIYIYMYVMCNIVWRFPWENHRSDVHQAFLLGSNEIWQSNMAKHNP